MKSLIIYDKRNLDSAFASALLKYYYEELLGTENEIDIISLEDSSYISSKSDSELKEEYSNITFINALFPIQLIDRLYNIFINSITFIICKDTLSKKIKNRYLSSDKFISGDIFLYSEKESCSMYIYKILKGNLNIPTEIKYISSFEMNNYPDEGFTRDEVMKYNYGLVKKYNNYVNDLYDYVKEFMEQNPSISTEEISSFGESYIESIDDYILYNYRIYGSSIYTISGNRKAILLQTPYKLSANIVGNELFKDFDNIITAYLTEEGKVLLSLYTLPNFVDVEYGGETTDTQESEIINSVFDSNQYLDEKYGSVGNKLFGFTEISEEEMCKIILSKTL